MNLYGFFILNPKWTKMAIYKNYNRKEVLTKPYKMSKVEKASIGAVVGGIAGGLVSMLIFHPLLKTSGSTEEEKRFSRRQFLIYTTSTTVVGATTGAIHNYEN